MDQLNSPKCLNTRMCEKKYWLSIECAALFSTLFHFLGVKFILSKGNKLLRKNVIHAAKLFFFRFKTTNLKYCTTLCINQIYKPLNLGYDSSSFSR